MTSSSPVSALSPSPTVAGACVGLTADEVAFWAETEQALAETLTLPDRTTDAPLSGWVGPVRAVYRGDPALVGEPLVAAGVALADVIAFARVSAPTGVAILEMGDLRLLVALDDLARAVVVPLGVRDAVGWALGAEVLGGDAWGMAPLTNWVTGWVGAWASKGLGERGWLYAAAGFTPDEAAAGIEDGTLDENRALVLAALRGAVLPAG